MIKELFYEHCLLQLVAVSVFISLGGEKLKGGGLQVENERERGDLSQIPLSSTRYLSAAERDHP